MLQIIYARAYTYEHQHNLLLGLAAKMSEEPFKILVSMSAYFIVRFESMSSFSGAYRCFQIVDSIIALFRVDFTGRGELADRQVTFWLPHITTNIVINKIWFFSKRLVSVLQQKLAQMLSRIIKIAEEFNVAVYMTNQGLLLTLEGTRFFYWFH